MNLTDQALILFRKLADLPPSERVGRIKYRAYLRLQRRKQIQSGTLTPRSIVAQRGWFMDGDETRNRARSL